MADAQLQRMHAGADFLASNLAVVPNQCNPAAPSGPHSGGILIGYHRKMQGSLFGGANPLYDIPMIPGLWHEGHSKLSELITRTYTLDEINEGYQDLMDGKNIRGVVVHQH